MKNSARAESTAPHAPKHAPLGGDEVNFVICVEANRLQPQGLLLVEGIRAFGGRYAQSPIFAVSPRPELALGAEARARFRDLGVILIDEPLNRTNHPYGPINRILAGAWAEAHLTAPYLVVLDTDTLFVAEPHFARADAGVRPVDVKGAASSGSDAPLDAYWSRMCAFAGIRLDDLPVLHSTVGHESIRASYNGGFTVVRRSLQILQRTKDIFFRSFNEDMRPLLNRGTEFRTSIGLVGPAVAEWWGSSQAALSVAIWSTTRDVHVYGSDYNIPVHLLVEDGRNWPLPSGTRPVLLHYHYLAEAQYRHDLRKALGKLDCSAQVVDWIFARLGIFD